jgi:hypothetical protein
LPSNLSRKTNILLFIPNEMLRSLPSGEVHRIFDHYAQSSSRDSAGGAARDNLSPTSAMSLGSDDGAVDARDAAIRDRLGNRALLRLSGDILERLRRLLADEMRTNAGGMSAQVQRDKVEREISFHLHGANEAERQNTVMSLLLSKAAASRAKSSTNGSSSSSATPSSKSSISRSVFMQVWNSMAQELFTVRTGGDLALGCVLM